MDDIPIDRQTIIASAPGILGSPVREVHFSEGRGASLEIGDVVGVHPRSKRPLYSFSIFIGWRWKLTKRGIEAGAVPVEDARAALELAVAGDALCDIAVLPDMELQIVLASGEVIVTATLSGSCTQGVVQEIDPDWWIGLAANGVKGRVITPFNA